MTTATTTAPPPASTSEAVSLVKKRNAGKLFTAAAIEVAESVADTIASNESYRRYRVFERLLIPDRVLSFRVEWIDDAGRVQVNRGWRIEHCNVLGPYKGGLRFHPTVDEDVLGFLAFEQCFKNALTGLPLGGGKGGSDFDPKGKSETEVMRFCQALSRELQRHIGAWTDVPAGDIGVGGREVGYIYGQYLKITNKHGGVLTGKPGPIGGLPGRSEATGYGTVEFAHAMLEHAGHDLADQRVAISGAGNVAIYAAQRALQLGGKVVSFSDSGGTAVFENGISESDLEAVRELKEERRGRLSELDISGVKYIENARPWTEVKCGVALPCATQHELDESDAKALIDGGVKAVSEGANMPCTAEAAHALQKAGVLYGPGKAANAGGVATSGFEMSQNATHESWTRERTLEALSGVMRRIHESCVSHGSGGDTPDGTVDYLKGANVAGFVTLADGIIALGV